MLKITDNWNDFIIYSVAADVLVLLGAGTFTGIVETMHVSCRYDWYVWLVLYISLTYSVNILLY